MSLLPSGLMGSIKTKKGQGQKGSLSDHLESSRSMPELGDIEQEGSHAKKSVDSNFVEVMKEVSVCTGAIPACFVV